MYASEERGFGKLYEILNSVNLLLTDPNPSALRPTKPKKNWNWEHEIFESWTKKSHNKNTKRTKLDNRERNF